MNTQDKLQTLLSLGFKYTHTEKVDLTNNKYSGTEVDVYMNETHRIAHWRADDLFTCKELSTTISTMIVPFDYAMCHYFKNKCK